MEIDITVIIVFVIGLLFGLLGQGVNWLKAYLAGARGKVNQDWVWVLDEIAAIGVRAAEQVYKGQKDKALEKLNYAANYLAIEAEKRGLKLDRKQIETIIEAKVFDIFTDNKNQ